MPPTLTRRRFVLSSLLGALAVLVPWRVKRSGRWPLRGNELTITRANSAIIGKSRCLQAIRGADARGRGGATMYFDSQNGDDRNDGLTPATPKKSTEALRAFLEGGHA